jgi:8-amino-7-oxononanoate synthase
MTALDQRITAILESRKTRQMLRSLDPIPSRDIPLVDFSSNDYLSFGRSKRLRDNYLEALNALPSPYGPPSSRLLDGNSSYHLALEAQLAAFFRADAGLLFNSGFDANVGLWSSLPDKEDWIVYDELIHASVHDGMRASRVDKSRRRPFKHNDCQSLEEVLQRIISQDEEVQQGRRSVWIGVETLYSMDGDLAPLKEFVRAAERLLPKGNGHMVVDEVSPGPAAADSSPSMLTPQVSGRLIRLGCTDHKVEE